MPQTITSEITRLYNGSLSHLKIAGEAGKIEDRGRIQSYWTQDRLDTLRRLWTSGVSPAVIVDRFDGRRISVWTRLRALKAAGDADFQGVSDSDKRGPWSPEKIAEFRKQRIAGVSIDGMGEHFGIAPDSVYKRGHLLAKSDLQMRDRIGVTRVAAHHSGMRPTSIPTAALPSFPQLPGAPRVDFDGLRPRMCRWLDDDDLYCGHTVEEGSYCNAHAGIVYVRAA